MTDEPTSYELAILRALNLRALSGTHVYDGRTPEKTVARRRARNRMARASRRANRR